jgi:hypothetical protein
MQFEIMTDTDKVTVYADVTKIEVEDIVASDEDEPVESYCRTIRFAGYNGEAIEVFCTAFEEKVLWVNRVRELKPVATPEEQGSD